MSKIAFLVTEDWYFVSHRMRLGIEARKAGYEVVVITRCREHIKQIESTGLRVLSLAINRRSLNPLVLMREILQVIRIYLSERPDIVHHVALKPVLVGGIAARVAGIRNVVSAFAGMGFLFTSNRRNSVLAGALKGLIPWLVGNGSAIVQNSEDADFLASCRISKKKIRLVRGAGVNIEKYRPKEKNRNDLLVIMASRLILDKGLVEFVNAARIIKESRRRVRFALIGKQDPDNPSSVSNTLLRAWVEEGVVEAWGYCASMHEILPVASIFCLPSYYREGIPKVLLEAMACGLPCVTTDSPGCRDAVRHQDNGLLVPIKDYSALAIAIRRLLDDENLRKNMGRRGRERAVMEFSEHVVITQTLGVYGELLAGRS